ncbi:guanine nucleotide exchange factor [Dactylonectria estremocensis]|uniref:Guanine nucleotide exchange factor n=1 Tax=Dactylonectria estremocensis TaxID=1079267 RepID=A0A9P9FAM7_9HYPO|nr:guanine nucleotide exchange factor [Dactylonectria estremocensis]
MSEIVQKLGAEAVLERDAALQQLLDLTRDPQERDWTTIIGNDGIPSISRCAFKAPGAPRATRCQAMKCLHNILRLSAPTRQLLVNEDLTGTLIKLMESTDLEIASIAMRLLLLSSIDTDLDLAPYFESHHLAGVINNNIIRCDSTSQLSIEPVLTLLSTLGANPKYQSWTSQFLDVLPHILELLERAPSSAPLSPLTALLISSLRSIPFTDELPNSILDKLIDILENSLPMDTNKREEDIETTISPLMGLLLQVAGGTETKLRLCVRLIASDHERMVPLGRGDSLPHRLIRLSADFHLPTLHQLVTFLLFKLSEEDPQKLLANVGYGYGTGMLELLGIPFAHDDDVNMSDMSIPNVNPITGQRLDVEAVNSQENEREMTQEEKEREAEKLFVLFERLKATRVVDIENPVAQSMKMGHVEEIEDSSDDDTKQG